MPVRGARGAGKACRGSHATEDEVLQIWGNLSLEQRQAAMRFEDVVLLERIRSALQTLFEKQMIMQKLCADLGYQEGEDAFETSVLLKHAFEFTWGIGRLIKDPTVTVLSPMVSPVMIMKVDFLQDPERLLAQAKDVLPDFLSPKVPRALLPRARWKELWASEPASISALEQQLAKLVEQAFWAMAADPPSSSLSGDSATIDADVQLEPWMAEHDEKVAKTREAGKPKKKKKKPKQKTVVTHVDAKMADVNDNLSDDDNDEDIEANYLTVDETSAVPVFGDTEEQTQIEKYIADMEVETSHDVADILVHGSFAPLAVPWDALPREDDDHPSHALVPSASLEISGVDNALPPCSLRPPQTPPSSPIRARGGWEPSQLVNYLWGQTSQFSSPPDAFGDADHLMHEEISPKLCASDCASVCGSSSASGAVSTRAPMTPITRCDTPSSYSSSAQGTPWPRGQWMPCQPQAPLPNSVFTTRAVIRNTFIDIEHVGDELPKTSSKTRSRTLSPTCSLKATTDADLEDDSGGNDQWTWYWT
jgi:hypothetical protein